MSDANTNLEKYIHTYFIKRNGIDYIPKKDVGYSEVTLTYMPSAAIADKITRIIINNQRNLGNIPFDIYDASGGIGGSTLSFLDNSEVNHVYTYEIVPERRAMEKVNVEAYNMQNKWTSLGEYTGTPKNAVGSVTYFDPPWLPHGTGLDFKKSDYIHENTVYAGHTLEEWLGLLTQCALVVYRLPPGYNLKQVEGWKYDIIDDLHKIKKNVRLIVCTNLSYPKVPGNTKSVTEVKVNQSIYNSTPQTTNESAFSNRNQNQSYQNNNYQNQSYQNNNYQNQSYENNNYQRNNYNQQNQSYQSRNNYQNQQNQLYQPRNNYSQNQQNQSYQPRNNYSQNQSFQNSSPQNNSTRRERYNKNENTRRSQSPEFKPSTNFVPVAAPKLLTTFDIPTSVQQNPVVQPIPNEIVDLSKLKNVEETKEEKDKWAFNLFGFLQSFLSKWISDFGVVQDLTNSINSNFAVWVSAFTTDSYDPFNNYDVLEKLGDTVLKTTFTEYLLNRFKDKVDSGQINEKGISNLVIEYTSKIRQAGLSSTLGLPKYVRINKNLPISVHISEDLFEALYGAIFKTGNNIRQGYGYILAYEMTKYIFDPIDILTAYLYDPAKTFVIQTFSSLGWGNAPKVIKSKNNDKFTFDIYFTEAAYESSRNQCTCQNRYFCSFFRESCRNYCFF
jgi:dsRNA-specific ribonuclease